MKAPTDKMPIWDDSSPKKIDKELEQFSVTSFIILKDTMTSPLLGYEKTFYLCIDIDFVV